MPYVYQYKDIICCRISMLQWDEDISGVTSTRNANKYVGRFNSLTRESIIMGLLKPKYFL